jgi:PPOX class probable F420-dependent enzyme
VTLDAPRIGRFLAAKEVVVLATVQRDGAPLAMPMWFVHDGPFLAMLSVADTQKVRNLRHDARVCVVAEGVTDGGAICGVTVQGHAQFLDDGPERRALVERFLAKYGPRLERIWRGRAMPPDRVLFRVAPTRVRDWGLA